MIGGAVSILKQLKAVDKRTKVWVGATNKRAVVVPWAWSDTEEQWSGQDDTRAQDNGAAAVPAY